MVTILSRPRQGKARPVRWWNPIGRGKFRKISRLFGHETLCKRTKRLLLIIESHSRSESSRLPEATAKPPLKVLPRQGLRAAFASRKQELISTIMLAILVAFKRRI